MQFQPPSSNFPPPWSFDFKRPRTLSFDNQAQISEISPWANQVFFFCLLLDAGDESLQRYKESLGLGGGTDIAARLIADKLAAKLGQQVIVENRAGAAGIIGAQTLARARPDGYTLVVVGVSTAASGVSLFKDLPYDPATDLAPIGAVAETPYLLVGSPRMPGTKVSDLYAYGAANPGKLTYAYGSGSAQVFGAKLAAMGKINVTPVPYRGGPQALTDVIGGTVYLTAADAQTIIEAINTLLGDDAA